MGRGYKILSERVFIGLRHGESWYDRESEDAENLTKEGRHKKNLLGAVAWILVGVCLGGITVHKLGNLRRTTDCGSDRRECGHRSSGILQNK